MLIIFIGMTEIVHPVLLVLVPANHLASGQTTLLVVAVAIFHLGTHLALGLLLINLNLVDYTVLQV
jgi:hypothetical protein